MVDWKSCIGLTAYFDSIAREDYDVPIYGFLVFNSINDQS